MIRFKPGVAGGLAVGFAAAFATIFAVATTTSSDVLQNGDLIKLASSQNATSGINRSLKSDRALVNVAENQTLQKPIVTVEVIGLSNAAIVYKDKDGQILYRTDPVTNVTVMVKNLTLPEVTIRETNDSTIDQIPLERTRAPGKHTPMMSGCETGLSPDISPTIPVDNGRCISGIETSTTFASIN
jgi:hypothetical protein